MPHTTYVTGTTLPAFEAIHTGWTVQAVAPEPSSPVGATVPGTVHTDLLAAGVIPDPYLGTAEAELTWMHRATWRYRTSFVSVAADAGERVDLVLRGLDTVADVELNGQHLLATANQHRSYRVDVGEVLRDGVNDLVVTFASALEHAEQMAQVLGARPHVNTHPFNMIRKMACAFGWDWGPDLQPVGIWQPVGLERWRARVAQLRPVVTVADGAGRVTAHVSVERADDGAAGTLAVRARVRPEGAGGPEHSAEVVLAPGASDAVVVVEVPQAKLWWPKGYGDQPRYRLQVELVGDGVVHGLVERVIAFRTVSVDTTPDEHGTPFRLAVNGRPVFAKGANWIPDDCFLPRLDAARYRRRVHQAAVAGCNMLRVWGGGIYESEDFYEACDAAGVMVWQDFLFACAAYPEEEPLAGEVVAEAREHVVRLMSHPSLVLWNGANENLWGHADWGWQAALGERTWGLGYYTRVLPGIVAELDPTRPYSTNSPYSPGAELGGKHPNDPDHGTHHEWECWNKRDYVHYRDQVPRFCSEFGWQGTPAWATLTRAIAPDARAKDSAAFLLHEKAEEANDKLDRGLAPHLPVPERFEDWAWATQVNQARAVRYAVEHYRSHWPRTAGCLVWQLNDCWPVVSWAAVDGDGRLKPLWYALRSAFADRLLSVQVRDGKLVLAAINDTDQEWRGNALARRTTLDGRVLSQAAVPLAVPARSVALVDVPNQVARVGDPRREVLLVDAGVELAVHTWAEDKDLAYEAAPFDVAVTRVADGYQVQVSAHSLVRDLTVLADRLDADAVVDRELVTLPAGESVVLTVRTRRDLPEAALRHRDVLRTVNALVAQAG